MKRQAKSIIYTLSWSKDSGYFLEIPPNKDGLVPEVEAMLAAGLRLENDPQFRQDIIAWYHSQQN